MDRVFIAAGNASVLAVNSQQWYVSISRGRQSAKVYVGNRDCATELPAARKSSAITVRAYSSFFINFLLQSRQAGTVTRLSGHGSSNINFGGT